jgi:hypothetical protein
VAAGAEEGRGGGIVVVQEGMYFAEFECGFVFFFVVGGDLQVTGVVGDGVGGAAGVDEGLGEVEEGAGVVGVVFEGVAEVGDVHAAALAAAALGVVGGALVDDDDVVCAEAAVVGDDVEGDGVVGGVDVADAAAVAPEVVLDEEDFGDAVAVGLEVHEDGDEPDFGVGVLCVPLEHGGGAGTEVFVAVKLEDPVAGAASDGGVAGASEVVLPGEAVDVPGFVGVEGGEVPDGLFGGVGSFVVDADDELLGDGEDGADGTGDGGGFVFEDEEGGEGVHNFQLLVVDSKFLEI